MPAKTEKKVVKKEIEVEDSEVRKKNPAEVHRKYGIPSGK